MAKKFALPKSLTTVTTFSKFIALFLFILLPLAAFLIGTLYQKELDQATYSTVSPVSSFK